jgi:multiple sugar transport system substrate-binding protein
MHDAKEHDVGIKKTALLRMAALAAASSLFLAGCAGGDAGGTSEGPTGDYKAPESNVQANLTISNWGNPGDEAVYDAAIKRFNKKYPNVKVTNNFTQVVNWSDYINKILTSVASGDAPDIINIATEGVEFGLSKDLFLPLTNYVKQDESVKALMADIDPNLLKGFTKGEDTYLVPNNWNAMVMYYNEDMFAKAGIKRPSDDWTWDEFLAASKKLTSGQGGEKKYGFGLQNYTFAYIPWLYSNGASLASDDLSKPTLNSPKTIESMKFLVKEHGVAPEPAGTEANDLFTAGKVAMVAAPANLSSTLIKGSPDLKFGIVPMPKKSEKATVFGAAGFSIYKNSKNRDLAWELLKELASQDVQKAWATLGTSNPTTHTAATSKVFLGRHRDAKYLYDTIKYAKPVAAPTFFTSLEPAFQRAIASILAGGDAAAELEKANSEVEATVGNG